MFSKVSTAPTAWSPDASIEITEDEAPSVIGDAAVIVGDLTSEGEIEVQGTVEGNIRSRRVTVGEGGQVQGEIVAEAVDVRGVVEGPIVAAVVSVARTARVIGLAASPCREGGYQRQRQGECRSGSFHVRVS